MASEIEAAAERYDKQVYGDYRDGEAFDEYWMPIAEFEDMRALADWAVSRLAADRAEREASKDRPLSCDLVEQQLVIRIGVATLKHAAEHCPGLHDGAKRFNPPYCEVADAEQLAKDVRGELLREEEDGTNDLHRLLDAAIVAAWEQGSIAFAEEEGGDA